MSILLLFESLISVTGEFVRGLGKSLKFTISAIFCSSIFVELSSLISFTSYFTNFTSVIKSCMVTSFMPILSCFTFFLSILTFSFFPHSLA